KKDLNLLLARLPDPDKPMPTTTNEDIIALANYYYPLDETGKALKRNLTYLGIVADPNMIPHYYYPSQRLGQDALEGYRVPSDNIYSDIDADLDLPPSGLNGGYPRLELADGRITGFDVQDVSALLSRTFFYSRIIENLKGPRSGEPIYDPVDEYWKNSCFTAIGTEPPVGPTKTACEKLELMWEAADFKCHDAIWDPATGAYSARQEAAPFYESANFIFICSHGFYYWYVPTGIRSLWWYNEVGAGGAFDVAHVKLMNFGPSIIWTDSCVTGRIDGVDPRNCLSHGFLHGGFNCYLGGTRSMWGTFLPQPSPGQGEVLGTLMCLYWYGYMCGKLYDNTQGIVTDAEPNNLPTGAALILAKNNFIVSQGTDGGAYNDDTYEEVLLHGDPAFNPYEPNHEGAG
ncbi:MAG: C25 family cysteine peptidase, partial [Candidatus Thermoplasmatota archaeon]